jgi:Fic family protein
LVDHPWTSFALDLHAMSPTYWMQLRELRSKCSHLAQVPLPEPHAEQLHQVSLAKGVHATTAIEGNTLTEDEVRAIIVDRPPAGTENYLVREVANVIDAYNWVLGELRAGRRPHLTPELIADFNRRVLTGLEGLDDHVTSGRVSPRLRRGGHLPSARLAGMPGSRRADVRVASVGHESSYWTGAKVIEQ